MKKKLVIFGTGDIAQIAADYFNADTEYAVTAFTVDAAYITAEEFHNYPVVPFEKVRDLYPPDTHDMFVALSYSGMNELRASKCRAAMDAGYFLPSYISPKVTYLSVFKPGYNCFIFEDNTIQPYVQIGDNVTIWSGNHIGHHSVIESHNFISSHVVISGHCTIKSNCFLGVNATVGHQVVVNKFTLLGAGSCISKDTDEFGVYVPARTVKLDRKSTDIRL